MSQPHDLYLDNSGIWRTADGKRAEIIRADYHDTPTHTTEPDRYDRSDLRTRTNWDLPS